MGDWCDSCHEERYSKRFVHDLDICGPCERILADIKGNSEAELLLSAQELVKAEKAQAKASGRTPLYGRRRAEAVARFQSYCQALTEARGALRESHPDVHRQAGY